MTGLDMPHLPGDCGVKINLNQMQVIVRAAALSMTSGDVPLWWQPPCSLFSIGESELGPTLLQSVACC